MSALTYAAALALAAKCGGGLPSVWLAGIALHESGLMPHIVSPINRNNTHDWGIGQINDATLAEVGLTRQTALDECQNMAGMARYLRILSSYHTGPAGAFDPVYVSGVIRDMHKLAQSDKSTEPRASPAWDAALSEPVTMAKGAQQLMVFNGWDK